MDLTTVISARQGQRATRAKRDLQDLAERRSDELSLIRDAGQLLDTYDEIDTKGDHAFISAARAHYALLTTPELQQSWARAMAAWLRDENAEERIIRQAHNGNAVQETVHHSNTPSFLGEAPGIPSALMERQRRARSADA